MSSMRLPSKGSSDLVLTPPTRPERTRAMRCPRTARASVLRAFVAAVAAWGLVGCRERATVPSGASTSRDCFADVDHVLHTHRSAFCRDLGRSVPAAEDFAATWLAPPKYRGAAALQSGCDDGDAHACFDAATTAATGWDTGLDGGRTQGTPDPGGALQLYRRSCDGGYDLG